MPMNARSATAGYDRPGSTASQTRYGPLLNGLVVLVGVSILAPGFWSWLAPASFARAVNFELHEHYLHDLGVFQIGIGVTVLSTLRWSDALTVALIGFLTANTLHAANHAVDLDHGGHVADGFALAALSIVAAVALYLRRRQLSSRKQDR
jgi:hypothetical protein